MFNVVTVDWGDNMETKDFGYDIVQALNYVKEASKFGNTDYALLLENGLPKMKYQDGEEARL